MTGVGRLRVRVQSTEYKKESNCYTYYRLFTNLAALKRCVRAV